MYSYKKLHLQNYKDDDMGSKMLTIYTIAITLNKCNKLKFK